MFEKSRIGAVANRLFRGTKGALTVAVLLGVLTLLLAARRGDIESKGRVERWKTEVERARPTRPQSILADGRLKNYEA